MALTRKQREILVRTIGFLDGASWIFSNDERLAQFAKGLGCVYRELWGMLDDDDRLTGSIEDGGDRDA